MPGFALRKKRLLPRRRRFALARMCSSRWFTYPDLLGRQPHPLDERMTLAKVGATPTDRVLRFLDTAGLAKRSPRNNPEKAQPGKKAQERAAAAAAAAAKAESEASA